LSFNVSQISFSGFDLAQMYFNWLPTPAQPFPKEALIYSSTFGQDAIGI